MDKRPNTRTAMLAVYSVTHLLVDLAGIFFLAVHVYPLAYARPGLAWLWLVLLYNFLAFALPMLVGLLADVWGQSTRIACAGCMLIFLGYLCGNGTPAALCVLLIGTGNGMFHIGGGIDILQGDGECFAPSGIFISTGAVGVFLGRRAGLPPAVLSRILMAAMAAASLLFLRMAPVWKGCLKGRDGQESVFPLPRPKAGFLTAMSALFLVVCLRSFYGTILRYPWASGPAMGTASMMCLVAGKMAGGILADRFGAAKSVAASLGAAALLALFSFLPAGEGGLSLPAVCGLLSILCFNMTMPLTLCLLARLFGRARGLAFGTLTFALFLGTLPSLASPLRSFQSGWHASSPAWQPALFSPWGLFLLCLSSMGLLLLACRAMDGPRGESGRP